MAPWGADLLSNLGITLSLTGKKGEALEVFRQAIALDPSDAESRRMIEQLSVRQ